MTKIVIEKGVHADIDESARLYDDLNDFLGSDINHPGWIKGVYYGLHRFRLYEKDTINGDIQ